MNRNSFVLMQDLTSSPTADRLQPSALFQASDEPHQQQQGDNEDEKTVDFQGAPVTTLLTLKSIQRRRRFSDSASLSSGKSIKDKLPHPRNRSPVPTCGSKATLSAATESVEKVLKRRRSSRKSINGLIIEFDMEDEDESELYANCEDYEEDHLKPDLTRSQSSESLEELRTHLEAVEQQQQLSSAITPEHDKLFGWGEDCRSKQILEALESSSHTSCSTASTARMSCFSLSGIAEEDDDDDSCGEEEQASVAGCHQVSKLRRHSSIRSSFHGLVLEYDWITDESDIDEGEEDDAL